jgi:hypothetical protein
MTQAFNLSQFANKVNTSGQADLTTAVTGTLPVANGGTGATTLASGNVLIGAGTSAVTSVAAGTAGNVLTSNGTTWTSSASSGGAFKSEIFTAPGTWTKPASCTQVRVMVIGGGGGTSQFPVPQGGSQTPGGPGGLAYASNIPVTGPVAITVGAGGVGSTGPQQPGGAGGTSSFGSAVSSTGGTASGSTNTTGVATVSSGTIIRGISAPSPVATGVAVISGTVFSGLPTTNPTSSPAAKTFSLTGNFGAGFCGISSPTVGSVGGVSGIVLVEYVG